MTTFVDDSGNYLDYEGRDIGLTKQAASFFEFKIKGDVSAMLKIPNNSHNRKALLYYGPAQIDSPAFSRTPFNMVRDGNVISRGYIVIKDSDDEEINVFYVSGNTNWFQNFQFNLKDIEFPDSLTVSGLDVDGRKAATDGLIFPLVDYFAQGAKSSQVFGSTRALSHESGGDLSEVHPWLYMHTLVRYMSEYGGVGIQGDLIEDNLFKKIIISPTGPEYFVPDSVIEDSYMFLQAGPLGSAGAGVYDPALDPQAIRFNTLLDGQGQHDSSTYTFTPAFTGTYVLDWDIRVNITDSYAIFLYKNGVLEGAALINETITASTPFKGSQNINLFKGNSYQFFVTGASANYRMDYSVGATRYITRVSVKLERVASGVPIAGFGDAAAFFSYVPPGAICPDMKAIDLIKFLAVYFSCVVTYDEYSNTIKINPISTYKKEDADDWSKFFVSLTTKWETKVARKNYIQTGEGPEVGIKSFNEQSNVTYGGGTIETDFDSMEERDFAELPFSGSWDDKPTGASLLFLPYVNFYDLEFVETTTYSGVTDSSGEAAFTSTWNTPITTADVYFVSSNSGVYQGYAVCRNDAALTSPVLLIKYVANDTGTITRYRTSKVEGPHRLMICNAGQSLTLAGGTTAEVIDYTGVTVSTFTTGPICWYDKPFLNLPIDAYKESLAIDTTKANTLSISERYYGPIKNVLKNPIIEAYFTLPLAVFQNFDFQSYIYLETKQITGYFLVQKIENYRDALTPVKVELLYADG